MLGSSCFTPSKHGDVFQLDRIFVLKPVTRYLPVVGSYSLVSELMQIRKGTLIFIGKKACQLAKHVTRGSAFPATPCWSKGTKSVGCKDDHLSLKWAA